MQPTEIVTLGTGGGRFAMITQKRRTAGLRIMRGKTSIHVDPGPGALVYSIVAGLSPQKLDALLISHSHPDHYTDAEVLVEAMTRGTTRKQGILAAPRSVLHGSTCCEQSISTYHQRMLGRVMEAKAGEVFDVGDFKVHCTGAAHTDPDAVGYLFESEGKRILAYTSDTEYFQGISEYYRGVRLLLLCVMRPRGKPWKGHMTTTDAARIVAEAKPEMAVLTHLGMQMIFHGPANEARHIEKETGVPTIAATDGMRITVAEKITISEQARTQAGLNRFL